MTHEAHTADDVTRPLPHAVGPEKSVLSSILQEPAEFLPLAIEAKLSPAHFYTPAHGEIFETLAEIYAEAGPDGIELVSLTQRFIDRGILDRVGGPAALADLYTYAPSPLHFRQHLAQVRGKFILRRLIEAGNQQIADAYDNPEGFAEALDAAEARILAIRDEGDKPADVSLASTVEQVVDEIQRSIQGPAASAGLSTGIESIDAITGGLKPGEMIVIAARPSMGKTALVMNIVEAVAVDRGEPALVFSLEMSRAALVRRLMHSRARLHPDEITKDKATLQRIRRASLDIAAAPLFIDDTAGITISELRAKARRLHRAKDIRLIAIDYLQLMRSTSRQAQGSREREIAEISQGVKALAKELALPIIILAQLNRGPETRAGRNVGRPRLSDLRESGAIEQDADVVGLLFRAAYYAESEEERSECAGFADLILAKNRNGRTGTAALTWIEDLTRFESGAPERRPAPMPKTNRSRWTED